MLRILSAKKFTAAENMQRDAELLKSLKEDPILHLYGWKKPSITYGYFIKPDQHLSFSALEKYGISTARRPTGGGIVFHIWDQAFSFLLPSSHPKFSENSLQNYQFVNEIVLKVVRDLFRLDESIALTPDPYAIMGKDCENFCMARPTHYDVVYRGIKVAGAAQRKTKQGYLHQGTISLARPDETLLQEVLLAKEEVLRPMLHFTFAPLGYVQKVSQLEETRERLKGKLVEAFKEIL